MVTTRRDGTRIYYQLASARVGELWSALRDVAATHHEQLDELAAAYLGNRDRLEQIGRDELAERLAAGDVVVIDVRPAAEFAAGDWGAGALLYRVPDPERFGVAEFDAEGRVVAFEEKPKQPKSDSIPIGVYFLRPGAFDVIEQLSPSGRGEFEITDVLNHYISQGRLYSRHYEGDWHDAGTIESLLHAAAMAAGEPGA
jgi:dTDP-glucose pyrophosphorylase